MKAWRLRDIERLVIQRWASDARRIERAVF